jgi:hypothetical protein
MGIAHPNSKQQLKADRREAIRALSNRIEVPTAVAVQVLAGAINESDVERHEQREQWKNQHARELAAQQAGRAKEVRRKARRQISADWGVSQEVAGQVLNGSADPALLIAESQAAQARKRRAEQEAKWLAVANNALCQVGVPAKMALVVVSQQIALDAVPEDAALRLWRERLATSGFASAEELIAAWTECGAWTADELPRARRKISGIALQEARQAAIWHFRVDAKEAVRVWQELPDDERQDIARAFAEWKQQTKDKLIKVSSELLVKTCAFGLRPEWREGKRMGAPYAYLVFCAGESRRVKWRIAPYVSKRKGDLTGLALYHHNYRHPRAKGFHGQRRYARKPPNGNDLVEYILSHEQYERERDEEIE